MASAEECFREAEKLEQEGGREEEAREMYKRAAKLRAAMEETSRKELCSYALEKSLIAVAPCNSRATLALEAQSLHDGLVHTEDSPIELPPGLDISRIQLSDSASDTSRDCSQPPGLGHAGRENSSSESKQYGPDESKRELGEPDQAQPASNADAASSEVECKDKEKDELTPAEDEEQQGHEQEQEEDEEEDEEEEEDDDDDWETVLEIDKKIPQVSSKAKLNRPLSNSSSIKGRGNFCYGSSSHMDEDVDDESTVEGGEVDDLREHGGRYNNCNRDLGPNRAGSDEEIYKNQTPSRPRPKTTAVVANRLIANALNHGGLRQHIKRTDHEAGRALEKSRQAKREERSRAQALRDSAWDD